jgi:hypothetical protein
MRTGVGGTVGVGQADEEQQHRRGGDGRAVIAAEVAPQARAEGDHHGAGDSGGHGDRSQRAEDPGRGEQQRHDREQGKPQPVIAAHIQHGDALGGDAGEDDLDRQPHDGLQRQRDHETCGSTGGAGEIGAQGFAFDELTEKVTGRGDGHGRESRRWGAFFAM